jgi:phage tail sheath protein FI
MKTVLLIIGMIVMKSELFAQDSLLKLQIPVRKMPVTKTLSIQQSINYQINSVLDSIISNTKGKDLYVNNIITAIEKILYNYWRNGKLAGTKSSQAYFIQCGRQTMTPADLENGNLIVAVGIACIKPAELELLRFERITMNKRILVGY